MRSYIINGCAIVDRVLNEKGGSVLRTALGGGAIYAMTGIKLWGGDCTLSCYSGKDFSKYYGEWMTRNGFSSSGVKARFERTNVCDLYYLPNGTHTMGDGNPDYLAFPGDRADMDLLAPYLQGDVSNSALHLVTGYVGGLLESLQPFRRKGLLLGYEIDPEDTAFPDIKQDIARICREQVDFFSISFEELHGIFPDMRTISEALAYTLSLGCPTFLRAGENGAYMIQGGQVCHTPMISAFGNVDPTGCGNSSTAAAFFACCESLGIEMASVMGAVTASLNAAYRGPIETVSPELREQCEKLIKEYI